MRCCKTEHFRVVVSGANQVRLEDCSGSGPPQPVQTRLRSVRLGPAQPRSDRRGLGQLGWAWLWAGSGLARPEFDLGQLSLAWLCSAWFGSARFASAKVWFGTARLGPHGLGLARLDAVGGRFQIVSPLVQGGWLEENKM